MNEKNLEELEQFFVKIYNDPICFFCFEETMKDDYKMEWNKSISEPRSLDFMYQKLNKVLMNDDEKAIHACDHSINLVNKQIRRMMSFFDVNQRDDEGNDHSIPKKIDPL